MLCGGIQPAEITEFASSFVPAHTSDINAALNANNQSYTIKEQGTQIVNGVNHFLHLVGSDHQDYTITVLERPHPNHGGVIIEAANGHHPYKHGYGNIVHHLHPNHPEHQPFA